MSLIYKICDAQLWNDAVAKGVFAGAGIDLEDGFIHFSTAAQVAETARRHFLHRTDLVLVAIDTTGLEIVWEPSRGGDLFPHLYSDMPASRAVSVMPLTCDEDGVPRPKGGYASL